MCAHGGGIRQSFPHNICTFREDDGVGGWVGWGVGLGRPGVGDENGILLSRNEMGSCSLILTFIHHASCGDGNAE